MSQKTPDTSSEAIDIYTWWDDVPGHLKTQEQLKRMGLLPTGEVRARVVYGSGRRARSYDLYDQRETCPLPRKQLSDRQRVAQERDQKEQSERRRTCQCCRKVMPSISMLGLNGICVECE